MRHARIASSQPRSVTGQTRDGLSARLPRPRSRLGPHALPSELWRCHMLKPCLTCGLPSDQSRCPDHRPKETRDRRARGYTDAWQRLSRRARTMQPFCSDCGATDDLQADHSPEAWRRHEAGKPIRLQDIDVVCGPCNRRRGAARPAATSTNTAVTHNSAKTAAQRPTRVDRNRYNAPPEGKAQRSLHTERRCA